MPWREFQAKVKDFCLIVFKKPKFLKNAKIIDSQKTSWSKLYKIKNNKKILNMNILITGGAGYVGSKLVPKLLDLGNKVTVLDLMIYGEDVLEKHKNLKKIKGDIRDINLLERVLPSHEAVIHLALYQMTQVMN